ncbi:hypothetical protein NKG99_31230 [Mesorhizobium sp. M1409]|uniref:hypothetical protein n=1 Tax=unclassified Mesorhizobium TaxID=325217 RepID=UPI00333CB712
MNPIRQVLNVLLPIRPISGKSPVRYRTTAQALSSAVRIARRRKAVDPAASFATESVIEEIENSSLPWDFLKDRSDDATPEPTPAMAKKTVGIPMSSRSGIVGYQDESRPHCLKKNVTGWSPLPHLVTVGIREKTRPSPAKCGSCHSCI